MITEFVIHGTKINIGFSTNVWKMKLYIYLKDK